MKKLLGLGLLCATALALNAQTAEARLFCWGCNKYSTYICVRPYNAFSPVCYGTIVGDGCMPLAMNSGYFPPNACMPPAMCCPPPMCCPPMGCPPMGCGPSCCDNGGCLPPYAGGPPMPHMPPGGPSSPMPQGAPPQFNGPMPTPGPAPMGAYYNPYGYAPVTRAAYQPPMPGYYPYGYAPVMPTQPYGVPGYWYNDR